MDTRVQGNNNVNQPEMLAGINLYVEYKAVRLTSILWKENASRKSGF